MDDFEQQLRRQTPAAPPEKWRVEILEAARQSGAGLQPVIERPEKVAPLRDQTAQPVRASQHGQSAANHFGLRREAKRHAALATLPQFPKAVSPLRSAPADRLQTCPTLLARFREWLWPHPAAWASLAAIWIVLLGVQRQTETAIQSEMIALRAGPEEVLAAFAQRQQATERLLAGLDFEVPVMDRPRPVRRHPLASPPLMLLTT